MTMEAPICKPKGPSENATTDNAPSRPASLMKEQEAEVVKFAARLGTKAGASAASSGLCSQAEGLVALLSSELSDQDVVLSLPSLDMRLSEDMKSGDNPLPKVGEHSSTLPPAAPGGVDSGRPLNDDKGSECPTMTASVLSGASDTSGVMEQKAASNLGKTTSWTRSTLRYASGAVATNVSESFRSLVDARVRAWTLLLLRQSLSNGDPESRSRLLSMLSSTIKMNSSETKFKTLPLPETVARQPKEADVVLPLLFEAVISISFQERVDSVTLRSPGTISANFASSTASRGIKSVQLRLDPRLLVSAMVDQARIVVLKAVASATKTPFPPPSVPVAPKEASAAVPAPTAAREEPVRAFGHSILKSPLSGSASSSNLSGIRSALNLSQADLSQSPQLAKARSSALRLNGVLHGKSDGIAAPSLGPRKVRSVKWDSPVQMPSLGPAPAPSAKKQRMAQTAANLKSFKSFGRPHGGGSGSGPRNATFGEYGFRQAMWGRDGRMAQHPMPVSSAVSSNPLEGVLTPDRNETFDMSKHRAHIPSSVGSNASMSRTPTFLENWFVGNNGKMRSSILS